MLAYDRGKPHFSNLQPQATLTLFFFAQTPKEQHKGNVHGLYLASLLCMAVHLSHLLCAGIYF